MYTALLLCDLCSKPTDEGHRLCVECETFEKTRVATIFSECDYYSEQGGARIWRFCDAPEPLRRLSNNGGDEDWLVYVPRSVWESCLSIVPPWLEALDTMRDPQIYERINGDRVVIGAHS